MAPLAAPSVLEQIRDEFSRSGWFAPPRGVTCGDDLESSVGYRFLGSVSGAEITDWVVVAPDEQHRLL